MRMDEALYSYLSTHAGLSALVGTRIYPVKLPQNVSLPAVTYQKISGHRVHAMQTDPGYASPRFQISCWAVDSATESGYDIVKAVAEQARAALQDYRGTMGGAGGVVVDAVFLDDENDFYEDAARQGVFHVAQEYIIWHQEAVTAI